MTQQIRESREQAFKEITIWADGAATVNHTYLLNGDKAVAYIRYGTSEPFWFKTPIRIDKRGRKFEQVDSMPFYSSFNVVIPGNVKEVLGSKGAKYIVDLDDNTCTCPGYTYRGDCKHIKELETA